MDEPDTTGWVSLIPLGLKRFQGDFGFSEGGGLVNQFEVGHHGGTILPGQVT